MHCFHEIFSNLLIARKMLVAVSPVNSFFIFIISSFCKNYVKSTLIDTRVVCTYLLTFTKYFMPTIFGTFRARLREKMEKCSTIEVTQLLRNVTILRGLYLMARFWRQI